MGWLPQLLELVERRVGLAALEAPVRAALATRAAELARGDAARYLEHLDHAPGDDPAWTALLEGIANTQTSFLREPELFQVVQRLFAERAARSSRPLRVWSAACSTGEEAYSLALCARQAGAPCEVLGTDLLASNVERARAGRYATWTLRNVDEQARRELLVATADGFAVGDALRSNVRFAVHNLLEAPPAGPWDLILCCNALIYFDRTRVPAVLGALALELAHDGRLALSASEAFTTPPGVMRTVEHGRMMLARGEPHELTASQRFITSDDPGPVTRAAVPAPQPQLQRPDWVAALVEGHVRMVRHEFEAALGCYRDAAGLAPECWEPELFLGLLCRKRGDVAQARVHLERALFLAPRAWWASYQLAGVHQRAGDRAAFRYERERTLRLLDTPDDAPALSSPPALVQVILPGPDEVRRALSSLGTGGTAKL